jgi:hypothetical protein
MTGSRPLCDIDANLRLMARNRLKRDGLTRGTVQLSDSLFEFLLRHFSAEEAETVGRALIVAASAVSSLVVEARSQNSELDSAVALNIIGFAGGRMLTDGRDWTAAQREART